MELRHKDTTFIPLIIGLFFVTINVTGQHLTLTSPEWENYKSFHGKNYTTRTREMYALFYYNYNSKLIALHNQLYARGLHTYGLAVNQFTDMPLIQFNALFPLATPLNESANSELPSIQSSPDVFDPRDQFALDIMAQDQGLHCGSGWAYAVTKAIELRRAYEPPNTLDYDILSAQNLIDCAGQGKGCRGGQVPQMALEYLVQHARPLYQAVDYANRPEWAHPGMCLPPVDVPPLAQVSVTDYAQIPDGNDHMLRTYVSSYPAVIEYNPTSFEFMHYSEGIFQQPRTSRGSHFMTVIGYGSANVNTGLNINTNNNNQQQKQMDYWLLVNSFGPKWGENGFMRIARSTVTPLAKSTIMPMTVI